MKRFIVVVGMLVIAALLASCVAPAAAPSGAGDTAAQPEEKIDLVFRQGDPPGEIAGLETAVQKWNEENPNIQVTIETVPWSDAQAQFVREVQAGGGPDVAQIAFVWTADLGKQGLLMDLTSLIAESAPGAGMDDFLATDLAIVDDAMYGIPWTVDTATMVYRPDLLEAAGVEEFPQTWADLSEVAKQLTLDTTGDGRIDQYGFCWPAGSGPDGATWFLVNAYLWSNGLTLVEQDADGNWVVGVTPEELAGAMSYFNSFFEDGSTPESLIAVSWEGDPALVTGIASGDCAMTNFRLSTFRLATEEAEVPIVMALEPQGSEGRASHLGGRTLGINPNTKHTEAAWEFLKFLTSATTFETYNQFPAQKTLLGEITPNLPEAEQAYAEQLTYGRTFRDYIVSPANTNSMWAATNREFGAVFSGQKTAEQAAQDMIAELNDLLQGE